MYMLGKVEVIWGKIKSYRAQKDVPDGETDPWLIMAKEAGTKQLANWEDQFKKEMLAIYPDLRSYVHELEAIAMCQSPMHQELAAAKERIATLEEQVTTRDAPLKKTKTKKKAGK